MVDIPVGTVTGQMLTKQVNESKISVNLSTSYYVTFLRIIYLV